MPQNRQGNPVIAPQEVGHGIHAESRFGSSTRSKARPKPIAGKYATRKQNPCALSQRKFERISIMPAKVGLQEAECLVRRRMLRSPKHRNPVQTAGGIKA